MSLTAHWIQRDVESRIVPFEKSRLRSYIDQHGPYAIKFVPSRWAVHYASPQPLKISNTPALTWGSATYVTPLAFPLSSALYGRIGVVAEFAPAGWRIFDATDAKARMAYVRWARAQPIYADLLLTVHSTHANHLLRNAFREQFTIDCVLFYPDQEAEIHTDCARHVWMAVTDWTKNSTIDTTVSRRFQGPRFTVLLDEDFVLQDPQGLPVRVAKRQIEQVTEKIPFKHCVAVSGARTDPKLPKQIAQTYRHDGFLHVFVEP